MEGLAKKIKIVVVCGPTASGKTGLALHLSRIFGGEMVAADSMQVYRGLVVGTAAVTPQEAAGVPQHLTGFLPPQQGYSVAEYLPAANNAIGEIAQRKNLPIVCGGTGLYISSLVEGTRFSPSAAAPALRQKLQLQLEQQGGAQLLAQLAQVDPEHAATLHAKDHKRILRALEQWELTGQTNTQRKAASKPLQRPYQVLCLGLNLSSRQALYQKIEQRVDKMLQEGLLHEAKWVYDNRSRFKTAAQAIGYKEFFPYFTDEQTLEACVTQLKQATRNYAKRQLTWFKRMPEIHWIEADSPAHRDEAEKLVADFIQLAI